MQLLTLALAAFATLAVAAPAVTENSLAARDVYPAPETMDLASMVAADVQAGNWVQVQDPATGSTEGQRRWCPRVCLIGKDDGHGHEVLACWDECMKLAPPAALIGDTAQSAPDVSLAPAPTAEKRNSCGTLCVKYHCCQSSDTCTCGEQQITRMRMDIATGALTVEEVLAAHDINIEAM